MDLIALLPQLLFLHVNRKELLRNTFKNSEYLDRILAEEPQTIFIAYFLHKKANEIIQPSTNSTSVTSFVAGLPSNPALAIAASGADVTQYFSFALNMAQQLVYLFGEDELFIGGDVNEPIKGRIMVCLGGLCLVQTVWHLWLWPPQRKRRRSWAKELLRKY